MTPDERFNENIMPEPNSGCWLWMAYVNEKGYGIFSAHRVDGRSHTVRAHRYSWEINCSPIPAGLMVLHKCDTPCCVNPQHLRLGTNTDNMRDMANKGRADHGTRSPFAKLTEDNVVEILSSDALPVTLAARFGVSQSVIVRILKGRKWKHIPRNTAPVRLPMIDAASPQRTQADRPGEEPK